MRPAYANLIDRSALCIHVLPEFAEAKASNAGGTIRYVAADPATAYEWDWCRGLTLVFRGQTPTQAPWDAMRAGASCCFFVDLDGELQQWKRA